MRLGTNTVSSSTKFKEDFVFPSKIHILHYWKQERLYMLKGRAAVRFLKIGTPKVMALLPKMEMSGRAPDKRGY